MQGDGLRVQGAWRGPRRGRGNPNPDPNPNPNPNRNPDPNPNPNQVNDMVSEAISNFKGEIYYDGFVKILLAN